MMNLPPSYNALIGRTRELAQIRDALQRCRLVTLLGPAGCGKTRLALECARQAAELPARRYVDGVTWHDLTGVTDPAFVANRLATDLELGDRLGASPVDRLIDALQAREQLLILDNCEHLLAACAALADIFLERCPRVTVLATSTQPLGLLQEQRYPVLPLTVPDLPATPNTEQLAAAAAAGAVQLFVQRARETFPAFELTPQNAADVITVCRRLDGLPLAIELAAARIRMLSPAQIAERLGDVFALLTRGRPEAPPKHQTLRAALEWSYRLLSAPEQALLRRLSVFATSFDVDMVEAVCGPGSEPALLDVLSDLEARSFVSVVRHDQQVVRYGLLETIRRFAREQLEAAGERETYAGHLLDWCVRFAEQSQTELERATQGAALARLEQEHDNLRAALQWAVDAGRRASGLRVASALERFWLTHGHPSEGRAWLNQLLEPDGSADPAVRARGLSVAGLLALRQNDNDQAEACFEACRAIWQDLADARGTAFALNKLGDVAGVRGNFTRAMALLEDSLRLWRELGDSRGIASVLISLGSFLSDAGDLARAAAFEEEALALAYQLGDEWLIAVLLNNRAVLAIQQGDWSRAESLLHETLGRRRALADRRGAAIALANLGEVALHQKDWGRARELVTESLALYQQVNDRGSIVASFVRLARIADAQGQAERAARLLGASEKARETVNTRMTPNDVSEYEALSARVRAGLDPPALASAWAEGRALPLPDAVAYAVSEPPRILPASVELYVTTFGQASVLRAGMPLMDADWRYAKARELVFYLLSHARASKEQLGLALYAEASPGQLRGRLHRVLHHARQALGRHEWIRFENDDYSFNRDGSYWFDVEQFERRVTAARAALAATPRDAPLAIRLLQDAAPLYAGDFLPDLDAEWVLFRREELRRAALEALLALGRLLAAASRHDEAIGVYRRLLELDNYLEVAHRELMRCFARQGDAGQARRHFDLLRQLLRDELGTEPSTETVRLDERIRAGQDV